jgi:vancomycin permeability regulator SanA
MSWCGDGTNRAMRFRRYPLGTYFQSDVIMAAKMMTKEVYSNINYSVHEQGEDVGWSYSCKEKGYRLFSASYIYAPHIMSQEMFNEFLVSGDNRLDNYNLNYTI